MSQLSLEQRVAALEQELSKLRRDADQPSAPWWKQPWAVTPDDLAALDEVARLGREYRVSLRPKNGPSQTAKAKKVAKGNKVTPKTVQAKKASHGRSGHGSRLAGQPA